MILGFFCGVCFVWLVLFLFLFCFVWFFDPTDISLLTTLSISWHYNTTCFKHYCFWENSLYQWTACLLSCMLVILSLVFGTFCVVFQVADPLCIILHSLLHSHLWSARENSCLVWCAQKAHLAPSHHVLPWKFIAKCKEQIMTWYQGDNTNLMKAILLMVVAWKLLYQNQLGVRVYVRSRFLSLPVCNQLLRVYSHWWC